MPSLLVDTSEGYRILKLQETHYSCSGGIEVWVFKDEAGNQVLTRVGENVALERVIQAVPDGLILEFGVMAGDSLRRLASSTGRKIYGFDWWKGLPHAWNEADGKGECLSAKPVDIPANCELIDGLFSDTLEPFLAKHHDPVAFVHIDCDLYSSTIYVLHCLVARFVTGSIIAFDEIDQGHFGELQAWARYLNETGQQWEFLGKQHAFGQVYRMMGG